MKFLWNLFRTIVWWLVALPLAVIGGTLGGMGAVIEAFLRRDDEEWNPMKPFPKRVGLPARKSPVEPPVPIDED